MVTRRRRSGRQAPKRCARYLHVLSFFPTLHDEVDFSTTRRFGAEKKSERSLFSRAADTNWVGSVDRRIDGDRNRVARSFDVSTGVSAFGGWVCRLSVGHVRLALIVLCAGKAREGPRHPDCHDARREIGAESRVRLTRDRLVGRGKNLRDNPNFVQWARDGLFLLSSPCVGLDRERKTEMPCLGLPRGRPLVASCDSLCGSGASSGRTGREGRGPCRQNGRLC